MCTENAGLSQCHTGHPPVCSGADPGFPVAGGADPLGAPIYDFVKISQKLHEIEKILGRNGAPPLDPPLISFRKPSHCATIFDTTSLML